MKVKNLTFKQCREIVNSPYYQGISGNGRDFEVYKDEILQHYWQLQDKRLSLIQDRDEGFKEAPFRLPHKPVNTYLKTKSYVYIISDSGIVYYRSR